MSLSREDAERIITDFDKVINRVDKKAHAMSGKMMIGMLVVVVIVIVVIVYLFIYRQKKGKKGVLPGSASTPNGDNGEAPANGGLGSVGSGLLGASVPRSRGPTVPIANNTQPNAQTVIL